MSKSQREITTRAIAGHQCPEAEATSRLGLRPVSAKDSAFQGRTHATTCNIGYDGLTVGGIDLSKNNGRMFVDALGATLPVPEPTSWAMFVVGLSTLALMARWRRGTPLDKCKAESGRSVGVHVKRLAAPMNGPRSAMLSA
jgi:hypothetical protein